ncbi:MAG TPA: VOC family protein [Devosia sp.]|nr:VOC family protein [Devosia sp.]
MSSTLNPYLHFGSNAREAMDFYRSVFGGELQVLPFGDMAHDPSQRDLVMHAALTAPNGFVLMGSDTFEDAGQANGRGMTVSISGTDEAELRGYWNKLADGAEVTMPLEKAPWGDSFGMLKDKFGVPWMINITAAR